MIKFTTEEKKLIDFAKARYPKILKKRRDNGLNDTYYACVLSNIGKIYEAIPFDIAELGSSDVCCERVAISNMYFKENGKGKVKVVLTVGPVGRGGLLTPCGLCRHVINKLSDGKATVLCAGDYFLNTQKDFDSLFKKMKKYTIKKLYPHPWADGKWD